MKARSTWALAAFAIFELACKDLGHKDGWDYVDADYSAVELFGPACETVKASGVDAVSVVFGCKSDELF